MERDSGQITKTAAESDSISGPTVGIVVLCEPRVHSENNQNGGSGGRWSTIGRKSYQSLVLGSGGCGYTV